jgi:hypothetical protein
MENPSVPFHPTLAITWPQNTMVMTRCVLAAAQVYGIVSCVHACLKGHQIQFLLFDPGKHPGSDHWLRIQVAPDWSPIQRRQWLLQMLQEVRKCLS